MPENITCEVDGVKEFWEKQNTFALKYGLIIFIAGVIINLNNWKQSETDSDRFINLLKLIACIIPLVILSTIPCFPAQKVMLIYSSFIITLVRSNF